MSSPVPPPPRRSALTDKGADISPIWSRWIEQLWDRLRGGSTGGGSTVARLIIATSVSSTADFSTLEVGDRVLVVPAAAGNGRFVTVATKGTLPIAAVVGSMYVVLRAF